MPKLALAIALFFSLLPGNARTEEITLASYLIASPAPAQLSALSKIFGLEHKRGAQFEVIIPSSQEALLLAIAPQAELLEKNLSEANRRRLQDFRMLGEAGYHGFDQVQTWMRTHEKNHPDLLQVVDYGISRNGKPLSALRISSPESAGKPAVMITAATHGDELITTEVVMYLVDRLVEGYRREDRLTKIIHSHNLYFVPVVNPDGFVQTNRYDGPADPNRSYPYPGHENAKPTPSIAGLLKLFSSLDLKASIDFHAYGELIMYPWAYTHNSVDPASRARFDSLTRRMAEANRYTYGPIADVIYVAPGSSADYYFWKKQVLSLGIEIGSEKIPSPSEFPRYFQSQEESTWRFLEAI